MNGAAIYHVARRQIAVPGTSAEAEVKAQKKRRAMMKKKKRKEQKDPENIQFTYQKKKEKKTYHMYN
jgi:3-hydroxymyristoyl/3-hydroxydecanoyl-(acyl carrier protein) dehydratase